MVSLGIEWMERAMVVIAFEEDRIPEFFTRPSRPEPLGDGRLTCSATMDRLRAVWGFARKRLNHFLSPWEKSMEAMEQDMNRESASGTSVEAARQQKARLVHSALDARASVDVRPVVQALESFRAVEGLRAEYELLGLMMEQCAGKLGAHGVQTPARETPELVAMRDANRAWARQSDEQQARIAELEEAMQRLRESAA